MGAAEPTSSPPPFALLFPGQGSQSVGMLAAAAATDTVVRETFDEASGVLGEDLWQLSAEGPAERLQLTANTQPVLLAAGVALWRSWCAAGGAAPQLMAGHSLGEFTALVCAGSLDFADALRVVRLRGTAMQEAVPVGEGAMAAVMGLDDARVEELCAAASQADCVAAVNYNAPGQVVIAGHLAAVDRAVALCRQASARRTVSLPVSAPFHSSLMRPAAERLREALAPLAIAVPAVPVVHNIDAECHSSPDQIRTALISQTASPVLWSRSVSRIAATGVNIFLECGPGRVLCGLLKRILGATEYRAFSLEEPAQRDAALRHLSGGVAA